MARNYSVGETSSAITKSSKPAPKGFPELGLPDMTGKTLEEIGNLTNFYLKTKGEIEAKYEDGRMPYDVQRKFDEYHEQVFKYTNGIKFEAKQAEKAERASRKAEKDTKMVRMKEVSVGITTELKPQENAMAKRIFENEQSKLKVLREEIARYGGNAENMPQVVQDHLEKHPLVISKSPNDYGIIEKFTDKFGRARPKRTYSIDEEAADPVKAKALAEKLARENIEAFALKLVEKTEKEAGEGERLVGKPIVRQSSSDPWAGSTIEINTTNRKVVWKTNMILNFSKYQNAFNQWPTRLVENEKRTNA